MKRAAAILGILAAIYLLPTIGMDVAASSRGVTSVPVPTDSWTARKYGTWEEKRAFRVTVDPSRYPDLDAVVAAALPRGKEVERGPREVAFHNTSPGIDRVIEFRMTPLDDPEKVENTLTVVEAILCKETFACYRHAVMKSFDAARSAYNLSNLAGIRKTPNAG